MLPGESDRPRRRIAVKEEDLEELYLLVQGAPYANTVLDAKNSFAQKDLHTTVKLIESARDRYEQGNRRVLRQDLSQQDEDAKSDQQQARRLKQKQDRCLSVLEAFDDLISSLQRMIRLRAGGKQVEGPPAPTTDELLQHGSRFRTEYGTATSERIQLTVIRRFFKSKTVETFEDLVSGELYFLKGKEHTYLIQLCDVNPAADTLAVRLVLSGQPIKPIPVSKLLELGKRNHFVQLVPKAEGEEEDRSSQLEQVMDIQAANEEAEGQGAEILDIGSFSQLHDAVTRTGMVGNADLISHVRDREFQRKDYQKAFQTIEGLFGKFTTAATRRDARLRQEDVDIASGKLKMSPKALMEKRARDIAESQRVDRARNRFLRVLEGLRVLMRNE